MIHLTGTGRIESDSHGPPPLTASIGMDGAKRTSIAFKEWVMEQPPKSEQQGFSEASLVGTLLEFHERVVHLVRESALDARSKVTVYERIHSLMDQLNDEFKRDVTDPRDFDLTGRLEFIYNEATKLVEELGHDRQTSDSKP